MKRIFRSLTFPAISILLILIIYGTLSIQDLSKKVQDLRSQNNNLVSQITALDSSQNQQLAKINEIIGLNNQLTEKLTESKVAAKLQSPITKTVVQTQPEQIIVTKTVTQTVNQEVEKNEATVTIQGVGSYKVALEPGDNAFTILKRASADNGFPLTYDTYSFGVFITGIAGINPLGNQYWSFYYNGTFSNVGASDQTIKKGDNTFWQLASF